MRYFFWTMLMLFFSCSIFAQQKTAVDYCDYEMGDTTVTFVVENSLSKKDIVFINVHENEATSIEALNQFDVKNEYKFFWLNHNATRRIFYNHRAELFSVDPNRIFSHEGIVATLAYDSIFDNRKAEKMAKALAHEILKVVLDAKWIISLHNNTPDNYSIKSCLPGGDEAPNTKDVFINDSMDPDDFIYTTNQFLFDELKEKNINVILQDNMNCINDGSLSVYCGIKGIPYANVEAEDGHLNEQIYLIKEVVSIVEGRATSQ